jgi:hypothetical protein
MALGITRLTLYKHGLGFFERQGQSDDTFTLEFPSRAMDDVLKSLTLFPTTGVVKSVAFATPPDRNQSARRQSIELSANEPISSVIQSFIGQPVVVQSGDSSIKGALIGLEREDEEHLKRALLAVLTADGVRLVALSQITQISLVSESANGELTFALEDRQRAVDRSHARITLSEPSEVSLQYIAPAPAWRVSYRVLVTPSDSTDPEARDVFVQGWGIFDNTLDEDLTDIQLTLTAGMPVSFQYGLHEPNTPTRPFVHDDDRTVSAPITFAAAAGGSADAMMMGAVMESAMAPAPAGQSRTKKSRSRSMDESAPAQASGEARGALFAYRIDAPITVRRGESAMVPILAVKTSGQRELLYNPTKNADHPAASIRFKNSELTLERGPATITDQSEYGGEAIVPFTPGHGEVILAFAMELGIALSVSTSVRQETVSISIRDGSLFVGIVDYIETKYRAVSQLPTESVVTIEHPRNYDSELVTEPSETTLDEARFKCRIAERGEVEFVVTEKRARENYENIRGINGWQLQQYLDGKLLSAKTHTALAAIIEQQARIETLIGEREQRQAERERVRARLEDTRENLAPLDATQDSKLRARFTTQLASLEDTMNALDVADEATTEQIASLERSINESVGAL